MDIFRDGTWYSLRLKEKHAIKYNAVINKVGEISTREISHSNTFSVPNITENQKALGLNVFNARELAKALNSKYIAKYYVGDKLIKEGFIVINNSDNEIKLNFLDGALGLVDTWKSTTFKQLLQSDQINRPTDYQTAIDEMSAYDMTGNTPWAQLSLVGSRGHGLALFPNTVNQIGDDFQKGLSGVRGDDVFIPAQSRPVFNAKAAFDLATESFGYTPTYDPSIDWDEIENNFFTGDKANEGKEPSDVLEEIPFSSVGETTYFVKNTYDPTFNFGPFDISHNIIFKPSSISSNSGSFLSGASVVNNSASTRFLEGRDLGAGLNFRTYNFDKLYNESSFHIPDFSGGNVGTLDYYFTSEFSGNVIQSSLEVKFFGVWETTSSSTDYVFKEIPLDGSPPSGAVRIDKTFLNTPPTEASSVFMGVTCQISYISRQAFGSPIITIRNMQIIETAIPQGEITFDEYGGYGVAINDLTHAAPEKPIKDVISGLMHQAGVLMNINAKDKTVKFFSYGHYENQKDDGNYYDWSEYFQKNSLVKRNTDYGKGFGKLNRIGLKKPYLGNTYDRPLDNHLEDSKYKAFSKDELKSFSDIIKVKSVANTLVPYFEYEISGMSMINKVGFLNGLSQKTPFGVAQGTMIDLAHLSNVNYYSIPYGVAEWYNLVDRALRVVGKFLLPVNVIKTLDITKPVYINHLGGFYIIEEISEYKDSKSIVNIKLIKLIDGLKES